MNVIKYPCNIINKVEVINGDYVYDLNIDNNNSNINYENYIEMPKKKIISEEKKENTIKVSSIEELNSNNLEQYDTLIFSDNFNQPVNDVDWSAPGHRRNWHL